MASAERRKRAGAQAEDAGVSIPPASSGEPPKEKLSAREAEMKILNPETVEFIIQRDGVKRHIAIPSQFTIGDTIDRRAMDDLESFVMLARVEASKYLPQDAPRDLKAFFETRYGQYIQVALLSGNVREALRELARKVGRILDADGKKTDERPSIEDVDAFTAYDSLMLSLFFLKRWNEVAAQQKNSIRTELIGR